MIFVLHCMSTTWPLGIESTIFFKIKAKHKKLKTSTTSKAKRGNSNKFFHLPHLLAWPLFFLYFWPLKQWSLNSLFSLSPICSSVSSLFLLWSSSWSSLHLFPGFLLHNQQFALSSVVSLCLCLCLCYQSKRVPSLLSKKKKALCLSLLHILRLWISEA